MRLSCAKIISHGTERRCSMQKELVKAMSQSERESSFGCRIVQRGIFATRFDRQDL